MSLSKSKNTKRSTKQIKSQSTKLNQSPVKPPVKLPIKPQEKPQSKLQTKLHSAPQSKSDKRPSLSSTLNALHASVKEDLSMATTPKIPTFDPQAITAAQAALAGAPDDAGLRVLLAHQPRSASASADAGFDVQLSGHTHGGQFWPFTLLVPLQQPFTAGLHRLRSLWVYTSRGTGYWGPPLRLGAPSEITRLRFVAV